MSDAEGCSKACSIFRAVQLRQRGLLCLASIELAWPIVTSEVQFGYVARRRSCFLAGAKCEQKEFSIHCHCSNVALQWLASTLLARAFFVQLWSYMIRFSFYASRAWTRTPAQSCNMFALKFVLQVLVRFLSLSTSSTTNVYIKWNLS